LARIAAQLKDADNNHEESDNHHEEEEERLAGRKGRRLSLSADRCENQGAE
jgi:F0F1-type ATP synthase membrane subunit b/b'